jgi:hypothetical protein
MRAYRFSVKLKLALIVFATAIAVASLAYTHRLVDRLREREQALVQLWADAQAQVSRAQMQAINPYREELRGLQQLVRTLRTTPAIVPAATGGNGGGPAAWTADSLRRYQEALRWAQSMPPSGEFDFITNEIIIPNPFGIPAIITDSTGQEPLFWRNVGVPDTLARMATRDSARAMQRLRRQQAAMDEMHDPIPIRVDLGEGRRLVQYVHYDESSLVTELRIFPYVQLLFVGLFVAVGYLGFSYVRRSEQSSLWVGMAREAAHQLGTPISSLMGWTEMLRMPSLSDEKRDEALTEIESDIERLQRVANRFSDIGSTPKLETAPIAPIVESTADYIQRRIPQQGQHVDLTVKVPGDLEAPVNEELFAWVVENLLKNALDALEGDGAIAVRGFRRPDAVCVEVEDTGRGIERQQWRNVFRPGYSTKQRGWGLGLSLARRVIEDYHGGELKLVDSSVGEGTTFRVELPA